MPFPSAGCQTCKVRRIKCDETKPTCNKCAKSRRICVDTDVATQASFQIHVENSYASGKTKRPRGPRSSLAVLSPNFDLQTRALTYYVQYHLQALSNVPNNSEGLSECVTKWKVSGRTCPMVDLALTSMSLAVFSRTQNYPPAAAEASSRYQRLLGMAQKRIAHLSTPTLDEQNVDACLLAVLLMGRYEGATHCLPGFDWNDSFMTHRSFSHHDGALAILKVWHDNSSHTSASYIIKQSRRGLIKSCLLRHRALPEWMLDGEGFGERGIELDYDRIVVRIVNLHARLQGKRVLQTLESQEMYDEARELDVVLHEWVAQIPDSCTYQPQTLKGSGPWPMPHFYSSTVYSYPAPGYAAAWSHYFAVRMLIDSTRLRVLELSRQNSSFDLSYEKRRFECISQTEAAADGLAASVPCCLDRFKVDKSDSPPSKPSITLRTKDEIKPYQALLAIWPLTIAACLKGIDAKQQNWFRAELAGLGKITGDGVIECADSKTWVVL